MLYLIGKALDLYAWLFSIKEQSPMILVLDFTKRAKEAWLSADPKHDDVNVNECYMKLKFAGNNEHFATTQTHKTYWLALASAHTAMAKHSFVLDDRTGVRDGR